MRKGLFCNSSNTTTNTILTDGTIEGLSLDANNPTLLVRNYSDVPIQVLQKMSLSPGASLVLQFDDNPWGSTICFDAGIPVALDGTLELDYVGEDGAASLLGDSFQVFDWTGVSPLGAFASISSNLPAGYSWDTSQLYTTGDVTLVAIPEPSSLALLGHRCNLASRIRLAAAKERTAITLHRRGARRFRPRQRPGHFVSAISLDTGGAQGGVAEQGRMPTPRSNADFETALKKVARPAVPDIEVPGVAAIQQMHAGGKIGFWSLKKKVVVISDDAIGRGGVLHQHRVEVVQRLVPHRKTRLHRCAADVRQQRRHSPVCDSQD